MRFLLPDPLGNDKHSQMFHTSGFAIAAGVVAVGAAAGSAAISMSAADRANKAQGKAGGAYKKQLKQATSQFIEQQNQVKEKISKIDPNLKIPEFNLQNATTESIEAANRITANTLKQIENIVPGSTKARGELLEQIGQWENNLNQQYQNLQANQGLIDQQRGAVSAMIAGRTTPQQDQEFNRKLAEGTGAAFNMQTARLGLGGFQTAQATYADQLMQSGERRMLAGLQLAPGVNEQQRGLAASSIGLSEGFRGLKNTMGTWMQLADSWNQNVPQMMGIGLQGRGQDIQVQQYGIQNAMNQQNYLSQINQGNYGALTGQAQNIYNVNKDTAAASYAAQQAVGEGVARIGEATSKSFGAYSDVLGQMNMAQGAGAGTSGLNTATGFYGTGAQAAKAYGVPASQIQYYQPSSGAGGYYYNA